MLTARDAADRGAEIRTRTRAVEIRQVDGIWQVTVENTISGARTTISARALVNAGGPWVEQVLASGAGVNARAKVRLVQGSHIVVRKLYEHDRAYMFQNADGRIIFVIPYQDDFTLIGTTDRDYDGDPAKVKASAEEIKYLCASVSEYLTNPVTPEDVVWTYSGVRPLYDDGASEAKAATRDYVFELDTPGGAPLLSIYGGKITTYRRLAEEALERLAPYLRSAKAREGWTGKSPLPGGDMDVSAVAALTAELVRNYPFLPTGACQPAGACLWHPRRQSARQREIDGRSRPVLRRQLDGKRSQVPDVGGMGLHRRRHRVAPLQARLAAVGRRNRRARRLDCGQPQLPANVPCAKREDGHERHARTCHAHRRWHPDHSRRLADARARHAERAARADAVGQDLDHAAARRSRQADHRPRAGRRQGRHRRRRAAALGRDGLSAVHQLSLADGL